MGLGRFMGAVGLGVVGSGRASFQKSWKSARGLGPSGTNETSGPSGINLGIGFQILWRPFLDEMFHLCNLG